MLIPVIQGQGLTNQPCSDAHDALSTRMGDAVNAAVQRASLDGTLVVDSQQRIVSYNHRFIDMWNIDPQLLASALDAPILEVVAAQVVDPQAFKARVGEIYAQVEATSRDDIRLKDGRTLDRYSAPVTLGDGTHFGRAWYFRDVTAHKTADNKVLEDASQFRALVEQQIAGIFIVGDNGMLLYINPRFSALFGYSPADVIGLPFVELVADADRDKLRRSMRQHLLGGPSATQTETALKRKGGGLMNVVAHASLSSYQGKPALVGILIDITEEKRARELLQASEESFRSVFNSVNDAIAVFDIKTQKFVEANPRACQMFGYAREEVIGLGMEAPLAGVSPYTLEDAAPLLTRALAGEALIVEWLCKAKDGHVFWVELSLRRALYGGQDVLLATAQDISKRKLANEALAYRGRVWHAVTVGVARLVSDVSLSDAMPAILGIAAEALHVDRMLVLTRRAQTGALSDVSVAYGWPEGANQEHYMTAGAGMPAAPSIDEWLAPLLAGIPVIADARSVTGAVADFMHARDSRSTLLMPMLAAGQLRGFVSLEARKTARLWTSVEVDALKTLSDVIGAMLAREQSGAQLRDSEIRFRALSDVAQDAIIMIDSVASVIYWNHAAERIFGYSSDEAMGKSVHHWLAPQRFQEKSSAGMAAFARTGAGDIVGKTLELAALRKGGGEFPIELSISSMQLGSEWHAVATIRDITERKRIVAQMNFAARHDELTGLANRAAFVEALQDAIDRAQRVGEQFAVLYLDLDHFKDVNDTLGHPIGDLLLQALADRLRSAIRNKDAVARFGGDEFALIQADIPEALDAAVFAEKLLKAIGVPFIVGGHSIRSGASVGIAVFGEDSMSAESLLAHADVALYRAKGDGRGTYRYFTDAMDVEVRTRVTLGADLRDGMAAGELYLMYQPQIDADTNEFVGIEALARWRHPTRGLVPPGVFIHIAEQSGIIIALGAWILREACKQMRAWLDQGIAPPLISVNLSGHQLKSPLLWEKELAAILTETSLPARCLELELTESVLMEVSRSNNEMLARLRKAGLRIAIDDFGTGYSSLEYLGRFPVDRIKISDSFIAGLSTAAANRVIVKAAIGLAHELNLDVVAEGVETAEQLQLVRSWGCRKIQGFYFSRPMLAVDLAAPLRAGKISPPLQDQAAAQ